MERNDAAVRTWLSTNMPANFQAEMSAEEITILAHTLVYSEQFEEYVHLHLKNWALVISLERPKSDEMIFKHYADRGVREYRKYVSKINFPGYNLPLRITKVSFTSVTDHESSVPMPKSVNAQALIDAAHKEDSVQFEFAAGATADSTVLCFAWRNVQKRYFLYKLACMCRRHGFGLGELRFAYLDAMSVKSVLIGTVALEGVKEAKKLEYFMSEFETLKSAKLYDPLLDLVERGNITGNQAYVLRTFVAIIEQLMTEVNAAMYTEDSIFEAFTFHPELTIEFMKLFNARFHPTEHVSEEEYVKLRTAMEEKLKKLDTGRKKHDDRRRSIFQQAINILNHVLRTNAYNPRKLGVGFRLNPAYMDLVPGFDRKAKFPDLPFSLFFVRGMSFLGMQCRFRDLARGGMRTVVAWDNEHERFERPNMFTECYNLAFTQQKKNKDIPEGGSKAICFVNANEELPHELELARREMLAAGTPAEKVEKDIAQLQKDMSLEYMYYNQRCFLKTWMTLFIWDEEKKCLKFCPDSVDFMKCPEYIYIGPDENFHDSLIDWLAHEAVKMGYYSGGAVISGKDAAGVNHKEYGVTSWGALQFLHQALKFAKIEGNFTVKLTGGPDGDVAGNFVLLLKKYYATRAKLVLVTDGSGTCYDPEGFDYDALEHMFHKVQMMNAYPAEKLHEGGWILCIKQTRQPTPLTKECLCLRKQNGKVVEDWISSNAAFALYGKNAHVQYADVFLPCGGRPRALSMLNINDFLDKDGKPTCKVCIEGANLYNTQEAREFLEDKGVLLFKDSSANKCGVVSSSYEILAGLTMTDEQFIKVKPILAKNILDRLEKIANDEARCMLEYYEQQKRTVRLSAISELVSQKINKFTDDLAAYLKPVDLNAPENKALLDIFINYIPEIIRKDYLASALKRVPDMHKKAIISTHLACYLVYNKGLGWWPSVVDILPILLAQQK